MTSTKSTECLNEEYSFVYGDEAVCYEVVRKTQPESAKKKIIIRVHPNCKIVVTAPIVAENADIHNAVLKQAKWIWNAILEFRSHHEYIQPKHYVSGEMQFYLGKRYVLKVLEDSTSNLKVKLLRGKLVVTLPKFTDNKTETVKALVNKWYKHKAQRIFQERLFALLPQASWVKAAPNFKILFMQKQWGSCSAKGTLMLNPHLIKAPKECIDYVILHELCHIAEHNHSQRFWRLLTQIMPHWQDVKSKLDSMAELYLNE